MNKKKLNVKYFYRNEMRDEKKTVYRSTQLLPREIVVVVSFRFIVFKYILLFWPQVNI
jgi:hypothetical protein